MPVRVVKKNGYQVSTPGGVKAKGTTKAKAQRQANLLRAVEHGWKPTGKKARNPGSQWAPGVKRFLSHEGV